MPRSPSRSDNGSHSSTLLAAGAGALAGVVFGVLLAQRLGGVRGIRARLRSRFGRGVDLDALRQAAGEAFADEPLGDEYDDDELELDAAEEEAAAALEGRVLGAFLADPVFRDRAVDISALDASVVELSGWVDSSAERRRAAEIARAVDGVSAVVNELLVGEPGTIDAAGGAAP